MTKKLSKYHKALSSAILSHPLWGTYVAFCLMFTTCYMINAISLSLFKIGTNDILLILMPTVMGTVTLIIVSRKRRQNAEI